MPSGRTHAAITTLAAAGLFCAGFATWQPLTVNLALAGGCLAGVLITPDLDSDEPVLSNYLIRREAGRLPSLLWQAVWLPYARVLPHRHWLSHAPVIGTALRLAYLSGIAWLGLALLGRGFSWGWLPDWWPWALGGLTVSDTLHWAVDRITTRTRRRRYSLS